MFKIEADNATIHFELGKNHSPKDYKKAYSSFERAHKSTLQTNGLGRNV
jgi:hypothetical protein